MDSSSHSADGDYNYGSNDMGSPLFTPLDADLGDESLQSPRLKGGKEEEGYPSWGLFVLGVFCINSGCNAFMFMDFATLCGAGGLVEDLFEIDDGQCNWLYSASLVGGLVP